MSATINHPAPVPMPSLWRMVWLRGLVLWAPIWFVLMLLWSRLQDGSFPSTSRAVALACSAVVGGILYGLFLWILLRRTRARQAQPS